MKVVVGCGGATARSNEIPSPVGLGVPPHWYWSKVMSRPAAVGKLPLRTPAAC
jgi:hypothetical protein